MSLIPPDQNAEFEKLIKYLKRTRGFDFTGYKRSSIMRRIQKRMEDMEISNYNEYIDYLEVHPGEFIHLFNTILINVTNFFRDVGPWEYLASDIIPQILKGKKPDEPLRVWSAGCASGEEAYTIAILMCEAIGVEKFRERVKIYASDADEDALNQARQASYTARDVSNIPEPLLKKYFEQVNDRYVFRKDLRRSVIFGRHDLTQDAPISRIDLLICRNTLMYFNNETQAKILARFHFALNEVGFLFLGKAEMLFTHANLFTPVDLRRRVFTKVPRVTLRERLMIMSQPNDTEAGDTVSKLVRFREAAFDAGSVAQIVIDLNGFVALINERARMLFNLSAKDIKRPLHELDISYRIGELKFRIEEVYSQRRPMTLKEVDWVTSSGDVRVLEVIINPITDNNTQPLGVSLSFHDVTRYKQLQEEVEHSNQELETAYEELQSTNEELETTNEELQSTIEELETTNEELQSTNEELETINEELQSANEELQTVNEELRRRTEELNQVNSFTESILTSLRSGIAVVDRDLRVQVWNHKADDLWGLRNNEVEGKNFLNLDIGLPVDQLRGPIRACLARESEYEQVVLNATNRRGKPILCRVTCSPLFTGSKTDVQGVILLMDEINPSTDGRRSEQERLHEVQNPSPQHEQDGNADEVSGDSHEP